MEYSFLFPLMQKLRKSIKKCKTYSRKATGLFFPRHGVQLPLILTTMNRFAALCSHNVERGHMLISDTFISDLNSDTAH